MLISKYCERLREILTATEKLDKDLTIFARDTDEQLKAVSDSLTGFATEALQTLSTEEQLQKLDAAYEAIDSRFIPSRHFAAAATKRAEIEEFLDKIHTKYPNITTLDEIGEKANALYQEKSPKEATLEKEARTAWDLKKSLQHIDDFNAETTGEKITDDTYMHFHGEDGEGSTFKALFTTDYSKAQAAIGRYKSALAHARGNYSNPEKISALRDRKSAADKKVADLTKELEGDNKRYNDVSSDWKTIQEIKKTYKNEDAVLEEIKEDVVKQLKHPEFMEALHHVFPEDYQKPLTVLLAKRTALGKVSAFINARKREMQALRPPIAKQLDSAEKATQHSTTRRVTEGDMIPRQAALGIYHNYLDLNLTLAIQKIKQYESNASGSETPVKHLTNILKSMTAENAGLDPAFALKLLNFEKAADEDFELSAAEKQKLRFLKPNYLLDEDLMSANDNSQSQLRAALGIERPKVSIAFNKEARAAVQNEARLKVENFLETFGQTLVFESDWMPRPVFSFQ